MDGRVEALTRGLAPARADGGRLVRVPQGVAQAVDERPEVAGGAR